MMPDLPDVMSMSLHLWMTFALVLVAMWLYASERMPMEETSLWILCLLLLFFHFVPFTTESGERFSPEAFLHGFANPALIAVMSLLILGQAIVNTGSLNAMTGFIFRMFGDNSFLSITVTLLAVLLISAFVNNTPATVVFIPIMLAVAGKLNISPSKVMIPLSYASILGGTTILIGSSTNLLVSGALKSVGHEPLGMFDFTVPGVIIAGVGLVYIAFVLPRLLRDRAPLSSDLMGDEQRQFVIQLEIDAASELVGKAITDENLLGIEDVNVKMLQRHEHAYLAPFDEPIRIRPFDVIVLTTTKKSLVELISAKEKRMFGKIAALNAEVAEGGEGKAENLALAEVLIAPASRMVGQNIEQIGFFNKYHCTVLGIQRRTRMITSRMTEIRLAAGDVLLVMGTREQIEQMRESKDLILMEWSTQELPSARNARRVNLIFGIVIATAAFEIIPIYISAFVGALAVIIMDCLTPRQAVRALDGQIILLVAAGLALSTALEITGGASFIAHSLIEAMHGAHPIWIMSALFGVMAVATNILSNNATALIFTPIAYNASVELGVEPSMFIFAVIFASNCCAFASPIGYQTNLLVMGPGHYTFSDYLKAGIPLAILVWMTYTLYAYMSY